jgi:hypothetical protein
LVLTIYYNLSYCLEFDLPRQDIKSAGLFANLSIIVSPSGTFTSLHGLRFMQNDEIVSTQTHHAFYIPGDINPWSESFNISNFHYFIHSINPSADPVHLVWQHGIPPQQGSSYGTRKCHHIDWTCTQKSCRGCRNEHDWIECEGFLNCTGEETTGVYTGEELGCSNESRGTGVRCGTAGNSIVIGFGIGGVPVRRKFSFWTVAKHRLRKYILGWGM